MPKFLLAYRGGGGVPQTPEAQQAAMTQQRSSPMS